MENADDLDIPGDCDWIVWTCSMRDVFFGFGVLIVFLVNLENHDFAFAGVSSLDSETIGVGGGGGVGRMGSSNMGIRFGHNSRKRQSVT